ncbi:hypothetical protein [Terrilactibacillus laevilacticus]|uniref:Transposase n=1 Tax=Terrilactibacillus laevilacticus TaxID=1380157 RepID=A0ABW5PV39_9BACI
MELHNEGISLRGIAASTGNSRQKVTEIICLAERNNIWCQALVEICRNI